MEKLKNFNSIKVRLEQPRGSIYSRLREFQFHKGAIRTVTTVLFVTLLSLFQFHKGAIRTLPLSVLVLLLVHFNSIKVRLELFGTVHLYPQNTLFQFHKGAIRTYCCWFSVWSCFISIP